jgi:FlaA1/EpsC-like NDP-sugar epimerase
MIRLARKLFSRGGSTAASVAPAVSLHELLGRPAVNLDTPEIQRFLAGKRVLVSGAGGSIGSEICRQIMKFCPGRILLVEQAENNLFEIDRELRQRWIGADIRPYIADICDRTRIQHIFQAERPHVVFHCAAHKHVPMMELNPCEAIKNNVLGTKVIADAAAEFGVAAFVMVSTDKAVNPTSVMGATKRMAEVYVQAKNPRIEDGGKNQSEDGRWKMEDGKKSSAPSSILHPPSSSSPTRFVAVRFGNVLGSSGSVVPIFQKQIEAGGPVTVTHPDMQRYFMTIPEASQLVMQAGAIGQGGEIFVLDMGEPIRILDLAKEMIARNGLKVGEDIEIQITGVRPGEKLYEELSCDNEQIRPTSHEKIHVWQLPVSAPAEVEASIERLSAVINGTREQAIAALMDCVPEFQPAGITQPKSPTIPTLRLAGDSETLAA